MSYLAFHDDDQTLNDALAFLQDFDAGEDLLDPYPTADVARPIGLVTQPPQLSIPRPPTVMTLAPTNSANKNAVNANAMSNANKTIANANKMFADNELDDDDREVDGDSGPSGSPTSSSSSSATSPSATHNKQDLIVTTTSTVPPTASDVKTGPKRVRKRQKDELIYLRSRVNELEERLGRLQKKSRGVPPSPTDSTTSTTSSSLSSSSSLSLSSSSFPTATTTTSIVANKPSAQLAAVWEKVAARQSQQRQESEVENAKLKEMLEEQIRVARALERLLRKRASGNLLQKTSNKTYTWNRVATKEEEATMFQELMQGLAQQFKEVDAVFTFQRFASRGPIFRDIQVRMTGDDDPSHVQMDQPGQDDMGEMYVEVLDSKILPFDLASTSAAFWQHMTRGESMMKSLFRDTIELTDDTMARSFGVEITAGPMRGEFRGKQCVRRYQEEHRTIIVWCMLAEPLQVSGMYMGGLLVRQKVWVELTPSAEDPTQATQMRARYMMTPDVYDDEAPDQDRKVGAITDFVIHSTHGNLNASHQLIENILLQTALLKQQGA